MNVYETERLLDEYLLFHYGTVEEILPFPGGPVDALHFPVRSVMENLPATRRERALDLGCAVGRSSFELSRFCDSVVGIDSSERFIDVAERLRRGERVNYRRHEEGDLFTELEAVRPEHSRSDRVRFEVADAMALPEGLGGFDAVHAANLICRLTEPQKLLDRLPSLVRLGGVLVLTTPCTWLEEFTPPERWPQGTTLDWLKSHLADHFSLEAVRDQPFLIREHARKFQWSVALATVWMRRH
ncbi:MAG: putative 4-mercaptohistidine N1-methyltransferase [Verrucomicrobiales bacterium]